MPHPTRQKRKKIFLFCCNYFIATGCLAQFIFTPAKENTGRLEELTERYEKIYRERLSTLSSAYKKEYKDVYTVRWKLIREKFEKGEVYTNPDAQQYLDKLVQEIVSVNPALNREPVEIFFSRSGIPNASYLGESIILFNMGLFKKLDNESQAAFIICHELAHFYFQHSDEGIRQYIDNKHSTAARRSVRKRNAEYRKKSQPDLRSNGIALNIRKHCRDQETEADSMAVELLRNTRFDVDEAITAMILLENVNHDTDITSLLQQAFHFPQYPLREGWMPEQNNDHIKTLKRTALLPDNTHPDIKSRINLLQKLLKTKTRVSPVNTTGSSERFNKLKQLFNYEIVEYYYEAGNYSRSLFHALEAASLYHADPYLTTRIGNILTELSDTPKELTPGKFIELPSPYQLPAYNTLLLFLQNLRKEECASISYHYLKQFENQLDFYKPYRSALGSSIQFAKQ